MLSFNLPDEGPKNAFFKLFFSLLAFPFVFWCEWISSTKRLPNNV